MIGGLEHGCYFPIYWESSSQLTFIFFRGVGIPPYRIHVWYIYLQNWVIYGVNVGKYSIHGSYGHQPVYLSTIFLFPFRSEVSAEHLVAASQRARLEIPAVARRARVRARLKHGEKPGKPVDFTMFYGFKQPKTCGLLNLSDLGLK